jgi:hypothetical protein
VVGNFVITKAPQQRKSGELMSHVDEDRKLTAGSRSAGTVE